MGIGRLIMVALFLNIIILNLQAQMSTDIRDIQLTTIKGDTFTLADYQGETLILVNTASECGLTPQLEDLQYIQDTYGDKGIQVLGFPSNDFAGQEPLEGMEILEFCRNNYGVTFPLSIKIHVKGEKIHPLYAALTKATGTDVSWNFQKFIIDKNGNVVKSIAPETRLVEDEILGLIKSYAE